ncbi:S-adenosylmethionine decarboxylase proenzyme [Puniceicoccus vermicola]
MSVVEELLREAADTAGATIVEATFHHFAPQGVSGVLVIAESHIAAHTWPEYGYAAIDCFTCGQSEILERIAMLIAKGFRASNCSRRLLARGPLSSEADFCDATDLSGKC